MASKRQHPRQRGQLGHRRDCDCGWCVSEPDGKPAWPDLTEAETGTDGIGEWT